jgi:hypothetical protein
VRPIVSAVHDDRIFSNAQFINKIKQFPNVVVVVDHGVVLGGWIVKLVGFMVLVASLRTADFIVGPVLFGSLVVSILGSLALDAIVFTKARIPSYESK